MDHAEAAKLKALLAELGRLCADAAKIGEQIRELTQQRPVWPRERWQAQPFERTSAINVYTTVFRAQRNN
jgi:hypothetical protein